MFKQKKDKTTYGIVGLGRFGSALARELASAGANLLVLDRNEEKIREFREITENALVVKNLDTKTLEETGIQNCDIVIVCIAEQLDTSILATLHLVSMNIPLVISKANSSEHGEILEKLGAEVVYPERDMAVRLANRLEASKVLDFMQLSEKINISKLPVPESVAGRTVSDVDFRNRFGLNIIAIESEGDVIETVLPDYVFKKGDILILSGSREGLYQFTKWSEKH